MSNIYFYFLLALLAGAMVPTQAAANNKLAVFIDSPVLASLISFIIGTFALFIYAVVSGTPFANIALAKNAPPSAWIGGFLGAFFVASSVLILPKLGVALTFGLIVAGQMILTLVLDHFGFFGLEQKPVSITRLLGMLLITGGVILIRKF